MGVHEQVVAQHDEHGAGDGVQRGFQGIAHPFGLVLKMGEDLKAFRGMKK